MHNNVIVTTKGVRSWQHHPSICDKGVPLNATLNDNDHREYVAVRHDQSGVDNDFDKSMSFTR